MPAQSRQAASSTSSAQAPAPAVAPRGGAQNKLGNAGVQERLGPLAPQVPEEIDLQSAGLAFMLPGPVDLTDDWNQLGTTAPTQTWVTCSRRDLRVSFYPPLLLDAQWPLSNVAISGFTYDFTQGRVSRVDVENTQLLAVPIGGKVEGGIRDFVRSLVAGTPLGKPGYDPLVDGDVAGTLRKVQGNFKPQGGGKKKGGGLDEGQITDFALSASARVKKAIVVEAGKAGLSIPAGGTLDVTVAVDGNGKDIATRAPTVRSITLGSSGITLQKDGKPVALLRAVTIARGGTVDVTDFEPLGTLANVGAGESLIKLLGLLVAVRTGDASLAGNGSIDPTLTHGLAEREMEKGFTEVVQQLVREHHDVVPGVDLRSVLGVEPKT